MIGDDVQRAIDLLLQLNSQLDGNIAPAELDDLERIQLAAQAELSKLLLRLAEHDPEAERVALLRLDSGG
ncbi:MAG TPA: hypothetical protein VNS22_02025 [Geminicoccus sp.]|uniref:hypothetical protein n=1 Tax=Geminicoccus sp. TaxID=2024832 RepID=UPI002D1D503B|nr:hypothetical protein [Geminicoccus sp.]HWL67140.1 hypothetical protein [Geminicoccus sp.]